MDVGDSSEGCCLLGVVEHDGILSRNCIDQSIGKSKQAAKLRYKVNTGIFQR